MRRRLFLTCLAVRLNAASRRVYSSSNSDKLLYAASRSSLEGSNPQFDFSCSATIFCNLANAAYRSVQSKFTRSGLKHRLAVYPLPTFEDAHAHARSFLLFKNSQTAD
jgi:hypothetical protein